MGKYTILKKTSPLLAAFCVVALGSCALGMRHYLSPNNTESSKHLWVELGQTPNAANKFVPQGLTYIDGYLYLAESHDNKIGMVYQIDPSDGAKITGQFQLPDDAVHTSGLAWDGKYLWAVDYASLKLYQINLKVSLGAGKANVINSYETGLTGPSAITSFVWKNTPYLALSDFRNSNHTYIIPHEKIKTDAAITEVALFSFKNKIFSQGLTSDDQYLYEATNKIGEDIIYKLDLCKLFEAHNFDEALVETIQAPAGMVEDLAIGARKIWTSDESTYRIYSAPIEQGKNTSTCP